MESRVVDEEEERDGSLADESSHLRLWALCKSFKANSRSPIISHQTSISLGKSEIRLEPYFEDFSTSSFRSALNLSQGSMSNFLPFHHGEESVIRSPRKSSPCVNVVPPGFVSLGSK